MNYSRLHDAIIEAKSKLDEIEERLANFRKAMAETWMEFLADPTFENVAPGYEVALKLAEDERTRLLAEVDWLEKQLPCQAFIDRFGLEMHEYYKAFYPINRDTRIQDVPYGYPTIHYSLPEDPIDMMTYRMDAIPTRIDIRHGEAQFKRFARRSGPTIDLAFAYAPEINVIFHYVGRKG